MPERLQGFFTNIREITWKYRRQLIIGCSVFIVLLLLILLIRHLIVHRTYSSYTVLSEEQQVDNVSRYTYVEGTILRTSSDGAALMRSDWEVLWNVTFNMTQPTVTYAGETILIYDKGNTDIRVYDRTGQIGQFSAEGPIITACTSAAGNVACAVTKGGEIEILYYNLAGEQIASVMTALSETGVPLSFALSPDGVRLSVAYVSETEGEIGTRLVFYDFGAAGMEKIENEIASETFVGTLLPELYYVNDDRMLAFRDNGISFYKNGTVPEKVRNIDFDREIVSLFHDDEHFGVLFRSEDADTAYDMEIYEVSGKKVGESQVNLIVDSIRLCEDRILILSGNELAVYDLKGFCHFDGVLKEGNVSDVIRTSSNRYFVFTDMKAETIKLS